MRSTRRRPTTVLPAALLAAAAGCAAWRHASAPAAPAAAGGELAVPEAPEARRKAALFDSDLGPDAVDVSAYPAVQRRNYEAYARVCSQCHTLARSINAPYVSRGWWEFYAAKMRVRARLRGWSLSPQDLQGALDFLEYDSNERKVAHAPQFERLRQTLKGRFQEALDERVEELQKGPQPRLLR